SSALYPPSLHDALPISPLSNPLQLFRCWGANVYCKRRAIPRTTQRTRRSSRHSPGPIAFSGKVNCADRHKRLNARQLLHTELSRSEEHTSELQSRENLV